ncbi:MAG: chemotaxis protein CheW [Aminipila sp.]
MINNGNGEINESLIETNIDEIEILVFKIRDQIFGVNVAEVREILMPSPVEKVPHGHPSVEGVYMPRDVLITVINLAEYLGIFTDKEDRTLFIAADVDRMNCAFRVNGVLGIERINVGLIESAENTLGQSGVVMGIVRAGGNLISLINFAEIIEDIAPRN